MIDRTLAQEQMALRLKREKLNAYQQRKLRRRELAAFVRKSRDILTGVYDQEMKVLGLWSRYLSGDVFDNRNGSPPKKGRLYSGWPSLTYVKGAFTAPFILFLYSNFSTFPSGT